jgi:hypothetical protein
VLWRRWSIHLAIAMSKKPASFSRLTCTSVNMQKRQQP